MQTAEVEKKACRSWEKGMQKKGKRHTEVGEKACRGRERVMQRMGGGDAGIESYYE